MCLFGTHRDVGQCGGDARDDRGAAHEGLQPLRAARMDECRSALSTAGSKCVSSPVGMARPRNRSMMRVRSSRTGSDAPARLADVAAHRIVKRSEASTTNTCSWSKKVESRRPTRRCSQRDRNCSAGAAHVVGGRDVLDLVQHAAAAVGDGVDEKLALLRSSTSSARRAADSTATTTQTIAIGDDQADRQQRRSCARAAADPLSRVVSSRVTAFGHTAFPDMRLLSRRP